MKRIFYSLDNDLYVDLNAIIQMAEQRGFKREELEYLPVLKNQVKIPTAINGLIHVN